MVSRMTKGTFCSSMRSKCCPSTSLSVSNPVTSLPSWVNPPIHLGCRKDSYVLIYWCHGVSFSHRLPSSIIKIGLDIFVRKLEPIFLNFTPIRWPAEVNYHRWPGCIFATTTSCWQSIWHPAFWQGNHGIMHSVMTIGLPKVGQCSIEKRLEYIVMAKPHQAIE